MPSTASANKCLQAVKHISASPRTRQLASLLMEFMAPGLRHDAFSKCTTKPFLKKQRYQSGSVFVQKFQHAYQQPDFADYVHYHGGNNVQNNNKDDVHPDQVSFDLVLSEFRRSLAIVDWFYIGKSACWFGNSKHTNIAVSWLRASDVERRRALQEVDTYRDSCKLTHAYSAAQGPLYQTTIPKRIQHLTWACAQPFLHSDKYLKKARVNFNLTPLDAQYIVLLYGLDVKLEHRALARFEKVRKNPELGKEVKKSKKKRVQ